MEKTLGELFDEYSLLYAKIEKNPGDTQLLESYNLYKEIISSKISYLSYNLELNILVNFLLRANKEYLWAIEQIENFSEDWLENSEDLAAAANTIWQAILVKEKTVKNIDKFMEKLNVDRL